MAKGSKLAPIRTFNAVVIGVLFLAFVLTGCHRRPENESAAKQPDRTGSTSSPISNTAFSFRDVQDEKGIRFTHTDGSCGRHFYIEQMGAGCAFIDYDNDGWMDVFAVNGAPLPGYTGPPQPRPALFHNLGNGKFEDVTQKAGFTETFYGHGVCAGDYDNDGFTDLFVSCTGKNHLYRNKGNGTFEDVTSAAGVAGDDGIHASASFVDYDNDGKLDLYVCGYITWSLSEDRWCEIKATKKRYCGPEVYEPHPDRLYRNRGNGKFKDVSTAAHIVQPRSKSLGVVPTDIDNDGWPDLYVACDLEPNLLLMNEHGRFAEKGVPAAVAFSGDGASEAGMGVCAVDYNNDGLMDLYVTNYSFEMDALYRNEGNTFFSYESDRCGVGGPTLIPLGFGVGFADFDNDGWQDAIVANGHVLDDIHETNQALEYEQQLILLRNLAGKFSDVSGTSGTAFKSKYIGRGLAIGDFDNDGLIDVLVNNCKGPLRLIRNEAQNKGNWIKLLLQGVRSNRSAIGARVTIETQSGKQTQEVVSGGSYLSQGDLRLNFGLGASDKPVSITVRWPGSGGRPGDTETWSNLQVNRIHHLLEGKSHTGGVTAL